MKKIIVIMATLIMVAVAIVCTNAFGKEDYVPEIELYRENAFPRDSFYGDVHVAMFFDDYPDYGECYVDIRCTFDDTAMNGHTALARLFSADYVELDSTEGYLSIDLSNCDVEEALEKIYDYAVNYNYEEDARKGIVCRKIVIW